MTSKWYINKRADSLNYGRHYCGACGAYALDVSDHKEFYDNVTAYAFCPHCGTRLMTTEKLDGTFEDVHQVYEVK